MPSWGLSSKTFQLSSPKTRTGDESSGSGTARSSWVSSRTRTDFPAPDHYREEFGRRCLTNVIQLPAEPYRERGLRNHHIYHQYVFRTPRRDALREHLARKEIASAIYYPLGLHQQDCFASLGYAEGDLPETERATRETVALPIYPEVPPEARTYVVESIAEFFARAV
jgi:dTDP-4-amino-4,6-dideoxygalactose transaminase